MDSTFKEKRISDIRNVWQSLLGHIHKHNRKKLQEISSATGYRMDHIERGLAGEDIPVTHDFIRRLVIHLGLFSGRVKRREDTYDIYDILAYDKCVELLKLREEPSQQSSLWDK